MATDNSVITIYRRQLLTQATSGGINTPIPPITKIAFGDGGCDGSGVPMQPSGAAAALAHEVARYNIDGPPTYPDSTTAHYEATVPENALVGVHINEAALIDQTGAVCAIKTMYPKIKDAGVAFAFALEDQF